MGNFDRRSISPLFKMETTIWLSLVLVLVTLALPVSPSEPRVVCYYTNWSVYRPGTARFNPQNINPYLCTHLIYAFGGFTKDNTLKPFDKYQDIEKGGYAKFTGLKTYNKQLKTMLAIGGWNEGSSRFSPMVAAKDRRKEFVRNAIKFLRQNHFDGLDLDWEYPAFRDGGKPKDRENYARLVKELREEFERESQKTGKPRLLLTMAVPAGIEYIQKGFDVKTLNRYLDWMNLLTYDYHSAFEPAVNHHAPLFPLEEPNEYSVDNELNIDHTIKFYLENGADREKLVLGIPTYGRSYTLFNPDAFEIGAPADGPGDQGDATREKGYLAYYEICEALKPKTSKKKRQISSDEESDEEESEEEEEEDLEWTVMHPNPDAMGPVAYRGNQWVGYDDIDIVKKKADYVAENGLGGIMFWSIDNDDFRGTCHGKPYPLIEAAKEAYIVKLGSTDNTIVTDKPKTAVNRRTRPRKPAAITTTTQAPAVKEKSHKRKSGTTVVSTTPSWSANTPEPPTTPDPGSDFKCTDEGFFQHPRDCKKYFWCLDSGPSNLGIVAHQFTCPSGLFFNKAADSCDFARNVLCKKPAAETTTTSKPTTTRAPTTTTTTRRPVKLSTKSSVAFRTTTTTTTTPEPEVSEEDVLDDIAEVEAEDPKVIKELIELIKKVGGVEQLEKQLHLAEGQASTDGAQTTTPASFNKKLYQKVLERTRKNKFGVISPNEGNSQNSRRGPQNAGLEASDDKDRLLKKDRPQYTTINRSRSRVSTTEEPLESEEEDEPETDTAQSRLRSLETEVKSTTGKPLQYVNIRRARPTVSTSDTADDTASRNALFERSETFVAISEAPNSLDVANAKRESIPEYVTIRRQRLTTEESTTAQYQESEEETELQETALEREISSPPSQQPQYTSILRTRSTTLAPSEEPSSPEPTTVLAVQISSLLNSPSSTEVETPDTETAEVTESTQPATTTTSTTTTTTAAPATRAPPRRAVLRRRGSTSTTTSTATPTTVTQVSSRNYAFVRRRRPLSRPNDITSDSDETVDLSRKVRSTTPNSREAELSSNVEPRVISRTRSRFTTQSDDSVPAAASQVSRGHFRPTLNRDDLLSLTPLDTAEEPVAFVQRPNFQRPERRFRPRTSTTAADKVEDSEVSAATVEVGSASILPRGRNRFLLNSATEEPEQSDIAKPTIRKFSPRPFGRTTSPSSRTDDIIIQENIDEVITKKTPARLSFGRVRPSSSTGELQPRKLPFLTRLSSTPQSLVTENDEPEDKNEDISLSESSLTENEHFTEEVTETPKRRIIIKKLRSGSTTTIEGSIPTEVTPGEGGRPRFRVIRRKPSSTTPIDDNITPSLETSTSSIPRIRKVIRKKLRPSSEEPDVSIRNDPLEQTTKEATSESISNYGEKSRTTISLTSTLPSTLPSIDSEEVQVNNDEENKEVLNKDDLGTDRKEEVITTQESLKEETKREEIKNDQTKEEHKVLDGLGENVIKQNSNILSTVDTSTPQIQTDISQEVKTEVGTKIEPEVIVETQQKTLELSDTMAPDPDSEIKSGESSEISEDQDQANDNIENDKNDSTSTTTTQPSSSSTRSRLPYRPPKRLFTSTTESSSPSSSRTFSRKYNPGAYTRPAERSTESSRLLVPASRRPLYSARTFTRRPFYTTKTTPKPTEEEEEEEYSDEDEVLDEEPENKLVLVPSSQLFTRKPENSVQNDDENYTDSSENEEEEDKVTPIHKSTAASRKPIFKPRIVNSNTFRTSSSTTELPKRLFGQNKTIINRFNGSKVNEPKKRVQNVPLGYVAPQINTTEEKTTEASTTANTSISEDISTTISSDNTDLTTEDDDYLTMTETSVTDTDSTNTVDISTTDDSDTTTEEMRFDINLDDYLEYTEGTTNEPTTQDSNIQDSTTQGFTSNTPVYTKNIIKDNTSANTDYSQNLDVTTENFPEVTTSVPQQPPVVKTQFDKLFSVSRVVEVNSKLDKHRLNKNNETTLIEEGKIMVEKKPMVDKIGEVSRFSLIKIVEDEIPIYLTKLGHVYPVDNPPDNPIRIDEARNARALVNFSDAPKENLIASESMNEAYRHVNMISDPFKKDRSKVVVEHVTTSDDFLSYINDEKVGKKTEDYQAISAPWQFVPAAYENEKNKAAKQFEIITPRNMLTDPSTLPVEALFKTEIPLMARKVNDDNQPYVVYSAAVPTQKNDSNIVQLKVLNAEAGRSIISFAKGQEFNGAAVGETSRNSPINIAVLPKSTISSSSFTTTEKTTNTSPLIELLTTSQTSTLSPEEPTTATTTELPSTTETILEDLTTVKISPLDSKRKFAFPRRPIGLKSLNFTRPTSAPRVAKKANITVVSNANQKVNKTSNFASRFSINRAQNVPIDIKKKSNTPKVGPKSYTTELPRTTSERKLNFKPLRPNLRPSFIPRKNTVFPTKPSIDV